MSLYAATTSELAKAASKLIQRTVEHLGRDMRAYMHVLNVGKTIGFRPLPHYRAVGGREFSNASFSVQHLLETHLCHVADSSFPANGWIDGFRFDAVEIRGADEVYLYGLFIWVEGQEHWWLDPGSISITFVPATDIVAGYVLTFGDPSFGLAKRSYTYGATISPKPNAWLFEFSGPTISGLNA